MLKALFSKLSRRPLILAFANPIFLFHRPIPLSKTYCATHFVTIIRVGRKDRTVPLGLAKTQSCAGHRTTHTGRRIGALGKLGDLLYWRSRLGMRTQFFLFSLGVFTADAS